MRCLVCQAGIVLAGRKPAAVFGFRMPPDEAARPTFMHRLLVRVLIGTYALHLRRFGVRVFLLGWREGRAMLLVWRPRRIRPLLSDTGAHAFLAKNRLLSRSGALMGELRRRLRAYYGNRAPFPHEIGFVLGYPIEDVDGFMSDGGQGARACGRWKVYGDVDEALRRFKELEREELRIKRLHSEGTPLRGLLRMATA